MSTASIKHHDQNHLGLGSVYFHLQFHTTPHPQRKSRQGPGCGVWCRGHGRMLFTDLLLFKKKKKLNTFLLQRGRIRVQSYSNPGKTKFNDIKSLTSGTYPWSSRLQRALAVAHVRLCHPQHTQLIFWLHYTAAAALGDCPTVLASPHFRMSVATGLYLHQRPLNGLSSETLTLSHSGKLQLLSMTTSTLTLLL